MVVADIAGSEQVTVASTIDTSGQSLLAQFNPLDVNLLELITEFIDHDIPAQSHTLETEGFLVDTSRLLNDLQECQKQLEEKLPSFLANANDPTVGDSSLEQERHQLCQRILDALSELLLHPAITRLVIRRFRPLLVDLVARWILHYSNDMSSSNTTTINSLNHTELVFIAFSVLLPVVPQVKSLALNYFHLASSPLGRLSEFVKSKDKKTIDYLYLLLQASYRLLSSTSKGISTSNFKILFDWSSICSVIDTPNKRVNYLARYCSSFIFDMNDNERQQLLSGFTHPDDLSVSLQAIDDEITDQQSYTVTFDATKSSVSILKDADLCRLVCNVCGVLMPRSDIISNTSPVSSTSSDLVLTTTTRRQLHNTALAVSVGAPVLLQGPTGVGKTTLVEALAQLTGRQQDDLIKVHIGDQTDSKILLGTYVATAEPGHFRWQPGVLTTAVRDGRWILIEDIDLAPMEVISVLTPLLESRELYIASRDEHVKAHPEFKLFATRRLMPNRSGILPNNEDSRGIVSAGYWTFIDVAPLPREELYDMIRERFPMLRSVAEHMIGVYDMVRVSRATTRHGMRGAAIKDLSMRDLIKWCRRVDALFLEQHQHSNGQFDSSTMEQQKVRELLFHEAADTFCGMIPDDTAWRQSLEEVGEALGVARDQTRWYANSYVPSIKEAAHTSLNGMAIDGDDESASKKTSVQLGRVRLQSSHMNGGNGIGNAALNDNRPGSSRTFARTEHASRLLEQIAVGVTRNEPVLLVGETGCGKTTVVQNLADMLGRRLVVLNLSQQSDASDLLGGFKPVDGKVLAIPLKETFEQLFTATFSAKRNARFLSAVHDAYLKKKWSRFATLLIEAKKMADQRLLRQSSPNTNEMDVTSTTSNNDEQSRMKRQRTDNPELVEQWQRFGVAAQEFDKQQQRMADQLVFNFVEGALVRALKQGDWILLDEVNLAAAETLECLSGLLQDANGSLLLMEKGEAEPIKRHPNFRVFACMNPATDVGKKDLPPGLRSRFTELYVQPPDTRPADLLVIIQRYLANYAHGDDHAAPDVSEFYLAVKSLSAQHVLADGANQRPHYSLRTLARALTFAAHICPIYGLRRSLYEGLCMTFLTLLNEESAQRVHSLIEKHILGRVKNPRALMSQIPRDPSLNMNDNSSFIRFGQFWLQQGLEPVENVDHYILTTSVERNLHNLARVVMSHRFPVLIQGPTSAGKTSMIHYLARRTGHRFVRVNNHEHTDLQEYLGSYVSRDGQLVFEEGVLVRALRYGHWIVLDELNLAPSEVLEALNRLLDDNRELVIPETQEIVRPHPHFMLFATQNPAGLYGGRKVLSRAFRNRFLELHFDDIPQNELETILSQRCRAPPSYCKRMVQVYQQLQEQRRGTRIFDGKHGFATLRDLFRWAGRPADSYQRLAEQGFMLLAERTRRADERAIVKRVVEQVMKAKIDEDEMYACHSLEEYQQYIATSQHDTSSKIAWTKAMKRLFTLVTHCLRNNEPVLLVGETGCGKTTVCQMLAQIHPNQQLHIVNCHQNTETADLIGGQRPVRRRAELINEMAHELRDYLRDSLASEGVTRPWNELDFDELVQLFETHASQLEDVNHVTRIKQGLAQIRTLFEWHDGPLVQAMKSGALFLLDEISLADDSVLERLNSVLEPERQLVLAEAGSVELTAHSHFKFLATMNPGGDYGKKELSPALRNRFTEIWVPTVTDIDDLTQIIEERFTESTLHGYGKRVVDYLDWFGKQLPRTAASASSTSNASGGALSESSLQFSLRDILTWVDFMNATTKHVGASLAFQHGACMVFLDGLGTHGSWASHISEARLQTLKKNALQRLVDTTSDNDGQRITVEQLTHIGTVSIEHDTRRLSLGPFHLNMGDEQAPQTVNFSLNAPTTASNLLRVLRAMQLRKPILLEGSPGVGKTSLIASLAAISGRSLVRINLSDQTDLMDLFGSDLPVEGGKSGEFAWRDAPFLSAMKAGHWVLLDEINLASQQVLEGLNSCLDHRGAVYLPELDRTFHQAEGFRIFAAQNPVQQGGGRKGLPKSFLNRFTPVFVEALTQLDLQYICRHVFPNGDQGIMDKMIEFNERLREETMIRRTFGRQGGPWEFNLRDVFRWLALMNGDDDDVSHGTRTIYRPEDFVELIYAGRMRTLTDRQHVWRLFELVFQRSPILPPSYSYSVEITQSHIRIGDARLARQTSSNTNGSQLSLRLLHTQLSVLSSIMKCIEMQWMPILIGPAASSKTSLVRWLAQVTGNPLDVFSLNSGVDTSELLGGFEQLELARYRHAAIRSLQQQLDRACTHQLLNDSNKTVEHTRLHRLKAIHYELRQWLNNDGATTSTSSTSSFAQWFSMLVEEACTLVDDPTLFLNAMNDAKQLQQLDPTSTGRFEWVDGVLIRAMEQGRWLLLDQANQCNPSVLDRLNSLLELNGTLLVNERGLVNGEVKVIRPHPNFRLFMTMDPRYGELSRAMRNRGVEMMLLEAEWPHNPLDLSAICIDLGVPLSMISHLTNMDTNKMTPRVLLRHLQMTVERLQRGESMMSLLGSASTSEDQQLNRVHNLVTGPLLVRDTRRWSSVVHDMPLLLYLNDATTLRELEAITLVSMALDRKDDNQFEWSTYLLNRIACPTQRQMMKSLVQGSIESMRQHALSQSLYETGQQLMKQITQHSTHSQWYDCSNDPIVWHAIHMPVNVEHQTLLTNYKTIRHYWLLLHRWQWMLLEDKYHVTRSTASNSNSSSTYSLLQLSYRVSRDEMPVDRLAHPALRFIYPILTYLHQWIPQLLTTMSAVMSNQHQHEKEMIQLMNHMMLWRSLVYTTNAPLGHIVEVIKWIHTSIEYFRMNDIDASTFDMKLIELLDMFMATASLQSGSRMKYIWRALHPILLQSSDLQVIERILIDASQVDVNNEDNSNDSSNNAMTHYLSQTNVLIEERQSISEAIATLYLLERTTRPDERRELLESMQALVMKLKTQRNTSNNATVDISLTPLMEYTILRRESKVLAHLQIAHSYDVIIKMKSNINQLYEQMQMNTTFSIGTLALYRRLLWLIEDVNTFESSYSIYQRTLIEIQLSWMTRLWHTSSRYGFNWFAPELINTNQGWHTTMVEGSALLYSELSTAYLLDFSYQFTDTSIGEYQSLSHRVKQLGHYMTQPIESVDIDTNQLTLLCTAVEQILNWIEFTSDISLHSLLHSSDSNQIQCWLDQVRQHLNRLQSSNDDNASCLMSHRLHSLMTSALNIIDEWLSTRTTPNLASQGRLWILVSLLSIELYVPDYAVDPASEGILTWHQLLERQRQLGLGRMIHQAIQRVLTGIEDNLRIDELSGELQLIEKQQQSMLADRVPRPESTTQLADVFNELRQIQQHHIDPQQIEQLLMELVMNDHATQSQAYASEALLQENLEQYVMRALHKFPLFRDLLEPLCLFLYQLKHGLRLVAKSAHVNSLGDRWITDTLATLLDIHSLSIMAGSSSNDMLVSVLERVLQQHVHLSDTSSIESLLLQLLRRIDLVTDRAPTTRHTLLPLIHRALGLAQKRWRQAENQRQQDKIESSSLYKSSSSTSAATIEHVAEDEDEQELKEINELFPTFVEEFSQYIKEDLNEVTAIPSTTTTTTSKKSSIADEFTETTAIQFSRWYIGYFLNDTPTADRKRGLLGLWSDAYHLAGRLANTSTRERPLTFPSLNSVHHLQRVEIIRQMNQLNSTSTTSTSDVTVVKDIYKDINVDETLRVVAPLERLEMRIQELLVMWPDHAVLLQILEISTRLRRFSLSSPIMRFLTGLELLLFKAQDWEDYAGQHVTLSAQLADITALIVRWRELELNSWPHLLDQQDEAMADIAHKWWFDVFSATLAPRLFAINDADSDDNEKELRQVLESLEQFIQGASLGQYTHRVRLLGAMYHHVYEVTRQSSLPTLDRLADALWHLYRYHRQFIPLVQSTIQQQRQPIERQLKESVKLASWKDVNVYALKQSAQKTHRQLTRFVRRYKEVLIQPVLPVLTRPDLSFVNEYRWPSSSTAISFSLPSVPSIDVLTWSTSTRSLLASRQQHDSDHDDSVTTLMDLPRLVERLHHIISRQPFDQIVDTRLLNGIDQLTTAIIERSTELRDASKAAIANDPKCAKHWKQLKRKALADLLKELRFIGLSSRAMIESLPDAMLRPCTHTDQLVEMSSTLKEACQRADDYYFRLWTKLPHLQQAARQANPDLAVLQVQKGLGFTVSLGQSLIRLREASAVYYRAWSRLKMATSTWQSTTSMLSDDHDSSLACVDTLLQHHQQLASLYTAVSTCRTVMAIDVNMNDHDRLRWNSTYLDPIESMYQAYMPLHRQYIELPHQCNLVVIPHPSIVALMLEQRQLLDELYQQVQQHESTLFMSTSVLTTPLSAASVSLSVNAKRAISHDDTTLSILSTAQQFIDMVRLSVQGLVKQLPDTSPIEDPFELRKHHLNDELHRLSRVCALGRLSDIANLANQLNEQMNVMSISDSSAALFVSDLRTRLYPFISQYISVADYLLEQHIVLQQRLGKFAYILCVLMTHLFKDGFCTPSDQPSSNEGETENNVQGTGIGEGEGAQDVTDEIEDEEQVLGRQGEDKSDEATNKDQEDTKKDSGMEMENDFEGQMEDVPAPSDDEEAANEDEEDDDDDEEELDEGIGEVDDQHEDAIDEKMWQDPESEQEEKSNENEKETKGAGNAAENDMVAGDRDDDDDANADTGDNDKNESSADNQQKEQNMDDEEHKEQKEDADGEEEEEEGVPDPQQPSNPIQPQDVPEAEMLQLDDDLELDINDDEDAGGEEEEPAGMDNVDDMQDALDNDEDDKEGEDGDNMQEGEDEEHDDLMDFAHQTGEDAPEEEEEDTANEPGEETPMDEEDDLKEPALSPDDEDDEETIKPPEDKAMSVEQSMGQGQGQSMNPEDKKQEEGDEERIDDDAMEQQASMQEDTTNSSNNDNTISTTSMAQQGKVSHERPSGMEETPQAPTSSSDEDTTPRAPDAPNPRRNLAEALKHWRERLSVLSEPVARDDDDDKKEEDEKDATTPNVMDAATYEFTEQMNDDITDGEALGAANQEQMDKTLRQALTEEQDQTMPDSMMEVEEKNEEENEDIASIPLEEEEEKTQSVDAESKSTLPPTATASTLDASSSSLPPTTNEDDHRRGREETLEDAPLSMVMTMAIDNEEKEEEEVTSSKETAIDDDDDDVFNMVDVEAMRESLQQQLDAWMASGREREEESHALWQGYEMVTHDLALTLCEQLRLILEPTLATRLKGDYRTGKRLNMKKIIPYIASQFKKDKIWLRRTRPSKRQYQVLLAIDDSHSMAESHSVELAYESVALISRALNQLEVGEMSVVGFGEQVRLLQPFNGTWSSETGPYLLRELTFKQTRTNVRQLLHTTSELLQTARYDSSSNSVDDDLWQLQIIISDGICDDHARLAEMVRAATERRIMTVFIVLDDKPTAQSITATNRVAYEMVDGKMTLKMTRYLDTFPFEYYVVLRQVELLPQVLADALRQYFSIVNGSH